MNMYDMEFVELLTRKIINGEIDDLSGYQNGSISYFEIKGQLIDQLLNSGQIPAYLYFDVDDDILSLASQNAQFLNEEDLLC